MTDHFASLDDFDTAPRATARPAATERLHVANGGYSQHACPRCNGTGTFRGYARTFRCNACAGSGKVGARVVAAAKGRETRERNEAERKAAFIMENNDALIYMVRRAERSEFYAGLVSKFQTYGTLTDNQLAAVQRDMAGEPARLAAFKAQRDAKGGEVSISAIEALFATATDNDIKRPVFRAGGIEISKAPLHGANAGALYVKSDEGTYLGKIVGARFHASREAGPETLGTLQAVAADPTAEAIRYARLTGRCSCCGKGLVDPVSIRAGIGPVCAENWGLDYRRDMAREELATEA
jgi:ribosomal protein L37AE/L43A